MRKDGSLLELLGRVAGRALLRADAIISKVYELYAVPFLKETSLAG